MFCCCGASSCRVCFPRPCSHSQSLRSYSKLSSLNTFCCCSTVSCPPGNVCLCSARPKKKIERVGDIFIAATPDRYPKRVEKKRIKKIDQEYEKKNLPICPQNCTKKMIKSKADFLTCSEKSRMDSCICKQNEEKSSCSAPSCPEQSCPLPNFYNKNHLQNINPVTGPCQLLNNSTYFPFYNNGQNLYGYYTCKTCGMTSCKCFYNNPSPYSPQANILTQSGMPPNLNNIGNAFFSSPFNYNIPLQNNTPPQFSYPCTKSIISCPNPQCYEASGKFQNPPFSNQTTRATTPRSGFSLLPEPAFLLNDKNGSFNYYKPNNNLLYSNMGTMNNFLDPCEFQNSRDLYYQKGCSIATQTKNLKVKVKSCLVKEPAYPLCSKTQNKKGILKKRIEF